MEIKGVPKYRSFYIIRNGNEKIENHEHYICTCMYLPCISYGPVCICDVLVRNRNIVMLSWMVGVVGLNHILSTWYWTWCLKDNKDKMTKYADYCFCRSWINCINVLFNYSQQIFEIFLPLLWCLVAREFLLVPLYPSIYTHNMCIYLSTQCLQIFISSLRLSLIGSLNES